MVHRKNGKRVLAAMVSIMLTGAVCGCSGQKDAGNAEEGKGAVHVDARDYALIDLHLHLDGSLSLESAKELAEMQEIEIPDSDEELREMLQVSEDCRDLNEYLEKFDFPCSLLQTEEAISQSVYNLCEELKAQGLIYAEIRFAPQKHTENGLTQEQVVQAALEGQQRSDFRSNLILCCMRGDDTREMNLETIDVAAKYKDSGVCAVDLAGAEALFPTKDYADLFQYAAQQGLRFTIHAGEADGPESVSAALDFGAERIGHGVRSAESAEMMQRLSDDGVPLELCPTSNLNTNIFEAIDAYPLRQLMDAGVRVTINTDNMTVSGTDLAAEMQLVADALSLTDEELQTLLLNAVDAAFADDETKEWLKKEVQR